MVGRRRYDTAPFHYEPGDYGLSITRTGEDAPLGWWVRTPNGLFGRLTMPTDNPSDHHEVEEHQDGTISVLPRPGNSNSILISGGNWVEDTWRPASWHGYIRHGVWEEC